MNQWDGQVSSKLESANYLDWRNEKSESLKYEIKKHDEQKADLDKKAKCQ